MCAAWLGSVVQAGTVCALAVGRNVSDRTALSPGAVLVALTHAGRDAAVSGRGQRRACPRSGQDTIEGKSQARVVGPLAAAPRNSPQLRGETHTPPGRPLSNLPAGGFMGCRPSCFDRSRCLPCLDPSPRVASLDVCHVWTQAPEWPPPHIVSQYSGPLCRPPRLATSQLMTCTVGAVTAHRVGCGLYRRMKKGGWTLIMPLGRK